MIVSNIVLKGPALPNIPWEERPSGCNQVLWRSATCLAFAKFDELIDFIKENSL